MGYIEEHAFPNGPRSNFDGCIQIQFDEALRMCCQAKNQLSKNHGFSPDQAVLGKSTQLPDSLSSDDSAAAHSLANGTDLDSHAFPRDAEQKDTGSTGIHSCGQL